MIAFGTDNASDLKVGTTQVHRAYLGTDLVWGNTPLPAPYDVEYNVQLNSGWGQNQLSDGDTISLTGNYWFGAWDSTNYNITSQYDWTISGDITLSQTEYYDNTDPTSRVLNYKYTIGSGQGTLTISDPEDSNRVFMTITFN